MCYAGGVRRFPVVLGLRRKQRSQGRKVCERERDRKAPGRLKEEGAFSAMAPRCLTASPRPRLLLCVPLLLAALPLVARGAPATPAPGERGGCQQYTNKTCEECLKNVTCLWCSSSKKCMDYPVRNILPPSSLCELSKARWGVCWVNFEALIITMSVVGGIIVIALCVCCCCCCRKKKSRKPDKDDERVAREREQRRVRQEERRAEMKSRHDEIRKKYGLFKEENPYAKFENN